MDAERYARVRELFLAAEDLPAAKQRDFLDAECREDLSLRDEVLSLLAEHDAESAQIEGEAAKRPAIPSQSAKEDSSSLASPFLPESRSRPDGESSKADFDAQRQRKREIEQQRLQASADAAQITQHVAQRTHATPRYGDPNAVDAARRRYGKPSSELLHGPTTRKRRLQLGWVWLAVILPTVLVGWLTYAKVSQNARTEVQSELNRVADSVTGGVRRFLKDRLALVSVWSRAPELRTSILELVETSSKEDASDALLQSPQSRVVRSRLSMLAQRGSVKYVVWDRTGRVIASWREGGDDLGTLVSPDMAGDLARVLRGETVLYGPELASDDADVGGSEAETPFIAVLVPIRDDENGVVATMLVRGIGTYSEFNNLVGTGSESGTATVDVYAVNRAGMMVSSSPFAQAFVSEKGDEGNSVACRFRVSDSSSADPSNESSVAYSSQPLTYSVAGASSGHSGVRMVPYPNYAGDSVVGVWRWSDEFDLGIVVERSTRSAFATVDFVGLAFVVLGLLISVTAIAAAARIAKQAAMAQHAVHPLSRYEVVAELGSGGMGVVYRARHKQLGRENALKVLRGDRDNLEDRMRFDREAKLAASLSNPHTVTVYDYGRGSEGEAYCVMEFLKGITLYDVVARSGYQPYGRVFYILRQICDSLGEAHHLGLVHRDMKPQNVMLSLDASVGDWAVVFDFGLAKPLYPDADSYQTAETIWAGTPMYMAPERYRDPNTTDPRSDIYSVGCIAYFLLSGRPPFIECDPESLFALVLTEEPISLEVHRDEAVPREIEELVNGCMAKNASDRFSTVNELASTLDMLIKQYPWSVEDARSWWRVHGEDEA